MLHPAPRGKIKSSHFNFPWGKVNFIFMEINEVNNEFKTKADEAVKKGVLYGYCPHHLDIKDRPELWGLPFNILFAKYRNEPDGTLTFGHAIYEPDLSTFEREESRLFMTYRNRYGGDSYVIITLYTGDLRYTGEKFVNGRSVGLAEGKIEMEDTEKGWALFFFQLTMLGLSNGEQCAFEKVEDEKS